MTPQEFKSRVYEIGDYYAKVGEHVIHVFETSNHSHRGDFKLVEIGLHHPCLTFYDAFHVHSSDSFKLFDLVVEYMNGARGKGGTTEDENDIW